MLDCILIEESATKMLRAKPYDRTDMITAFVETIVD